MLLDRWLALPPSSTHMRRVYNDVYMQGEAGRAIEREKSIREEFKARPNKPLQSHHFYSSIHWSAPHVEECATEICDNEVVVPIPTDNFFFHILCAPAT
jgi:hypothetical protein